ncbi:MAG TPA: nucleotidyltransferase domain-containing protein [Bryobacteraceae bacterium]|nr:nucleotidyltransferase domain-containing protein [Bryobacteraceae bacterium]
MRVAFVYGSIAEGSESASTDVDIMVVGDKLSFREIVAVLQDAQRELRREVNPSVYSVDEFSRKIAAGQHFVSTVVEGPKIFLIGDDGELGRLAKKRVGPGPQSKPARNRRPVRRRRS